MRSCSALATLHLVHQEFPLHLYKGARGHGRAAHWDICIFPKMQDTRFRQGCSTKGSQCLTCPTTLLCSLCFLLTPPARSPLQETAAAPGTPMGFLLAAFQHAQRSWWKCSGEQLATTEDQCTRAGRRVVSENAEKVSFWCLGS